VGAHGFSGAGYQAVKTCKDVSYQEELIRPSNNAKNYWPWSGEERVSTDSTGCKTVKKKVEFCDAVADKENERGWSEKKHLKEVDAYVNEVTKLAKEKAAREDAEAEREEEVEEGLSREEAAVEEGEEGRKSKGIKGPQRVSKQEREDHERTHCPYRCWCDHCVRARAMNKQHRKSGKDDGEDEGKVPRICLDYYFMSKRDEEAHENPVIIVLDESTNEKYSRATGRKGVGQDHSMDWLIKDVSEELKSWGHQGGVNGKIIMKCDNEESIVALMNAIAKFHGEPWCPSSPPRTIASRMEPWSRLSE